MIDIEQRWEELEPWSPRLRVREGLIADFLRVTPDLNPEKFTSENYWYNHLSDVAYTQAIDSFWRIVEDEDYRNDLFKIVGWCWANRLRYRSQTSTLAVMIGDDSVEYWFHLPMSDFTVRTYDEFMALLKAGERK